MTVSAPVFDEDEIDGPRREETKRLARVLRVMARLTSQPNQWTRARLAGAFEVGARSIDRDLELLRGLGYEITRSRGQGYAFARTPPLPPVPLSLQEVLALTLAAEFSRDSGDIDTASLGSALAHLLDAIPTAARPLLQRELLHHAEGRRSSEQRRAMLEAMQRAWLEQRRVRIVYATGSRGGEISERVIEPYAVYPYEKSWMVTAYDHRREEIRDFKIDRIKAATLLDERYDIPARFNLAEYRGPAWGILRGEASAPVEIELLFDAEAGRWAQEEGRAEQIRFEPQPDGAVLARLTAGITPEFVRYLLSYGPRCRVLAPDSLREQVRAAAEQIANLYV